MPLTWRITTSNCLHVDCPPLSPSALSVPLRRSSCPPNCTVWTTGSSLSSGPLEAVSTNISEGATEIHITYLGDAEVLRQGRTVWGMSSTPDGRILRRILQSVTPRVSVRTWSRAHIAGPTSHCVSATPEEARALLGRVHDHLIEMISDIWDACSLVLGQRPTSFSLPALRRLRYTVISEGPHQGIYESSHRLRLSYGSGGFIPRLQI